ncbi:hypothetical protein HK100_003491 [Physocladia obscura]|uniref:Cilia- and flagella-associated protein 58 central coiled coil domain-containing protein n=1 Tax=Physocladia obscura TaxID=109957 RepID=A0AAD5SU34_9FUNG|nr:hypothetical protein HK100_003491 [Physocladia obscura]
MEDPNSGAEDSEYEQSLPQTAESGSSVPNAENTVLGTELIHSDGEVDPGDDDEDKPATGDSTLSRENPAIKLLGSIVKAHNLFDEQREEAEIAALVKVALDDQPLLDNSPEAKSPFSRTAIEVSGVGNPDSRGGGGDDEQGLSENDKVLQQVKNTIRFLQENVANPANTPDDEYMSAGIGDAKFDMRMRAEYEKLHRLFITARRNNQGLVKKLRDMKSEIISNATKVEAAMKIFQSDRVLIASLRKEVKKAWGVVEMTKERELKAKETVFNLKHELDTIKSTDYKPAGFSTDAANYIGGAITGGNLAQMNMEMQWKIENLEKEKSELTTKHNIALTDVKVLNDEIVELNAKIVSQKKEQHHTLTEIDLVNNLLQSKKSDQDREFRIRDKLETAISEKTVLIEVKEEQIKSKLSEIKGLRDVINRLEMQVKDEKLKVEKEMNEKRAAVSRIIRLQAELEEERSHAQHPKLDTPGANIGSVVDAEHEIAQYKAEIQTLTRARENQQKQAKALEDAKLATEVERETAKGANYSLTRETDSLKKQLTGCLKQIEVLTKERDAAQKNFVKATGATQRQFNAVKLSDQTQRTLEHEITGFKEEASKMRKIIYSLEKERDHHVTEYNKMLIDFAAKDEELKMKDMAVFDCRKKIAELERKRKEQQQLYETVRTDRNLYSKNLIECEDEITELKRKLKIMGHQIEQLKEEISVKESDLAKGHFEKTKLEKEKEGLSAQIAKLQTQLEDAQIAIKNRLAEENKLRHAIDEGDAARSKMRKEYDSVIQARDVLGSQVIRRNEEISLLYEKIKIQTSTLNKGEIQYYERIEDIRVLKLEIKKLRREKAILQTETQNERTRVKLTEELESPLNIHRWRKLSGSDPTMFELIIKMQALQKRLIQKTEEVVEKETIINHKEKLYFEVKNLLQRQPGPEVLEELRNLKANVKAKVRECKSLASELNMYHSQVNEYKYEIQRVGQEYQDLKKKYYDAKKRERGERIRLRFEQEQANYSSVNENLNISKGVHMMKDPAYVPPYAPYAKDMVSLPALRPHPSKTPKFNGGGYKIGRSATAVLLDEKASETVV